MQLFIKTLTGKIITLDVEPYDSIEILKTKILEKAGIPKEQQRLVYTAKQTYIGRQLDDNNTIEYYNIINESIIYMVHKWYNKKTN